MEDFKVVCLMYFLHNLIPSACHRYTRLIYKITTIDVIGYKLL